MEALMQSWPLLVFWLLVGHSVCDYPLQTEWMVRSKVRRAVQPSSSSRRPDLIWLHVLSSHALIHGGAVALITQNMGLGLAETAAHWVIDFGKGERWYGFHTDQFLHLGCKLLWATWVFWS